MNKQEKVLFAVVVLNFILLAVVVLYAVGMLVGVA